MTKFKIGDRVQYRVDPDISGALQPGEYTIEQHAWGEVYMLAGWWVRERYLSVVEPECSVCGAPKWHSIHHRGREAHNFVPRTVQPPAPFKVPERPAVSEQARKLAYQLEMMTSIDDIAAALQKLMDERDTLHAEMIRANGVSAELYRDAKKRAEVAEKERDRWLREHDACAEERAEAILRAEAAEAKLAALQDLCARGFLK